MATHARVLPKTPYDQRIEKGMNEADNLVGVNFTLDTTLQQTPQYWINIYNIAHRSFERRLGNHIPCLKMRACPEGERYVHVAKIPHPFIEKWHDPDNGEIRTRGTPGERIAMDIVNPANTGIDLDAALSEDQSWMDGGTDDYSRRGLFFSRNDPPTDDEVKKAYARMEKFYRAKLQQARVLAQQGRHLDITDEHHAAADYFQERASWHTIAEVPSVCNNCGEDMKAGAAYHVNSAGVLCVSDWRRAVESGVKKYDEVPEEKRWRGKGEK
jgi:hypothetical protein